MNGKKCDPRQDYPKSVTPIEKQQNLLSILTDCMTLAENLSREVISLRGKLHGLCPETCNKGESHVLSVFDTAIGIELELRACLENLGSVNHDIA